MLLIGTWYDLSDIDVEDMVIENLSMMLFYHLRLEDEVPDHHVLNNLQE
ncbi:MAG: transposase [Ekhidna sp.]|nr:transposase [Ekhidna sp.]